MRYVVAALAVSACVFAQTSKRPFDADAMMRIARVSEPQLSPDGTLVAFTVERPDVNANTKPKQIYVAPVAGGQPLAIDDGRHATSVRAGRAIPSASSSFPTAADRRKSGRMKPDGSEQKAITTIPTEASGVIVSPDDKWIVFNSDVYPECPDEACNKAKNRSGEEQQSQSACIHFAALPPLDRLAEFDAQASDDRSDRRRVRRRI